MYQDVNELLGIPAKKNAGPLDLARTIERGLPASTIDRLKAELEITDVRISSIIGRTPKTLGRLRGGRRTRLSPIVSDRLFRIARIYALAKSVFEDGGSAREWLRSPQVGLGGSVPLDLLMTEAGERAVEDLLQRIEYGVIS